MKKAKVALVAVLVALSMIAVFAPTPTAAAAAAPSHKCIKRENPNPRCYCMIGLECKAFHPRGGGRGPAKACAVRLDRTSLTYTTAPGKAYTTTVTALKPVKGVRSTGTFGLVGVSEGPGQVFTLTITPPPMPGTYTLIQTFSKKGCKGAAFVITVTVAGP